MISNLPGISISHSPVTNIDLHGFWLLVDDAEYFVPFAAYPAFAKATIEQILAVQRLSPTQFHWPDLERFPDQCTGWLLTADCQIRHWIWQSSGSMPYMQLEFALDADIELEACAACNSHHAVPCAGQLCVSILDFE